MLPAPEGSAPSVIRIPTDDEALAAVHSSIVAAGLYHAGHDLTIAHFARVVVAAAIAHDRWKSYTDLNKADAATIETATVERKLFENMSQSAAEVRRYFAMFGLSPADIADVTRPVLKSADITMPNEKKKAPLVRGRM